MISTGERNNVLASLAGSMRSRGMGYKAIYAALSEFNITQVDPPLSDEEITTIARSISSYAPENALASSDFTAPVKIKTIKASVIDPSKILPRKWYMRERYIGGHISALVSQGGIGKSTLTMLDGMALCTGKPLSGFDVVRPCNVWIYNTEDPREELKRRMVALAAHHKIGLKELDGIHLSSGRDAPLILAKQGKDGVVINEKAVENVIEFIKANKIGAFIVDPFVRLHEVNENDNMQIDKVAWITQRIADATGCAVLVVHHTRKAGNGHAQKASMDDARGASALVNAARIAHVLQNMSEGEASRFGVPKEKTGWYSRLDNAKANLQPPAEHADWFKKVSVRLDNGDSVGAIERVELTDQSAKRSEEAEAMDAIEIGRVLARHYSPGDIVPIGDALNLLRSNGFLSEDVSDYKFRARLLRLLGTNKVEAGNRSFRYSVDEAGKRGKNFIVCRHAIDYGKYDFLR